MTGSIAVRGEGQSAKEVRIKLDPEQLGQLTLGITAALGVAAPTTSVDDAPTFGELAHEWLASIRPHRVQPANETNHIRHLRPLYLEDENTLTATSIGALIDTLPLSPSTRNKVRGAGRLAVDHALAGKRWFGPNPFRVVKRKKERGFKAELLSLEELARVQEHLSPDRRREFRVQLHLGLRTGELFALTKTDVDFERGVVHVRRSHERETTKTGRERTVPLHPAIAGDLLEARNRTKSELLFPASDGKTMQRRDTKLTRVIRTAMAAAHVGLVEVTYKYRRRGCRAKKISKPPVVETDCSECEYTMWAVAEVRPVRWYDLRHMCATLHHAAGANPLCVSIALGHSVTGTTQSVYTHPDDATMFRELTRWTLK